jgi:hypothetical protein
MTVWAWTILPLLILHVWWWRRARALLRFQLILDIVLAVVVGPALLLGADLNPVRCLENNPPFTDWGWSDITRLQPTQSDLVRQIQPWMEETRRHLLSGRLPLNSERIGGGLPLLANGQTGVWAPFNLPVWALGAARGTTVMALWKLELAGLGVFLFLWRRWRLGWSSAATGAVAFAGSAYLMAWLLVPMGWVIALIPWTWWGAQWLLGGRARVGRIFSGGLLAGWLLASGLNPETSAVVIGSAGIAGCIGHPRRWWRIAAAAAVAAVVVLVLAWPTFGYILASSRAEAMAEHNPNLERPSAAIRMQALQQLMVPMSLGHPGRGDWTGGYPYAAAAVGVGGLALGLVASGRVRRRHRGLLWAALACLAVSAVLGYRLPPLDTLLVRLPPLSHMTLPRFVVLVPWSLAVWAAVATDGALHGRRLRPLWRMVAVAAVLLVALVAVMRGLAAIDIVLVVVTVAATALAAWLLGRPRWLATLLAVELCLYAVAINPVAAAADRLPTPPLVDRLIELDSGQGGRLIGLNGSLPPNLACRYGLADLRAFDPLRPAPFVDLMTVLGDPDPILGRGLRWAPPRLCGAWAVRHLVTPPDVEAPGWKRIWSDSSGAIWSNPYWLPEVRTVIRTVQRGEVRGWHALTSEELDFATVAVVPPGSPEVRAVRAVLEDIETSSTAVSVRVRCDGPCLLVVARPWAPGWRATVDGVAVHIVRANLAGLGVAVPSGTHTAELRYNPWLWHGNVR